MGSGLRLRARALAGSSLFVDTSVWSLALRRDRPPDVPDALPFLAPDRHDHFEAAQLRGVQVGAIDAILAQLCIRYELRLLTTDANFARIAEHGPLECWTP